MRVGKIIQKQEWKGSQENVHEDQREGKEPLPAQPTGGGISGFGGETPPPSNPEEESLLEGPWYTSIF